MTPSRDPNVPAALAATLAGLAATRGDVLLVLAGASTDPASNPGLLAGHYLGVLGIPWYALGYAALWNALRRATPRAARVVLLGGGFGAALGAAIHGMTTLVIFHSDGASDDPMRSMAPYAGLLGPLWAVASLAVGAASLAFFVAVRRGGTLVPRAAAWWNPITLTLVIGVLLALAPALRPMTVVAPNAAHAAFFAAAVWWLARAKPGTAPV